MARLSKGDFQFFEREVWYWMKYFGLSSWECYFSHEKDDKALAMIQWDREVGNAVFFLATVWGKKNPINNKSLSQCAFHEVCELLLSELSNMSRYFVKDSEVNRAVHEVIRKLENTVFEYEWKKRVPEGI